MEHRNGFEHEPAAFDLPPVKNEVVFSIRFKYEKKAKSADLAFLFNKGLFVLWIDLLILKKCLNLLSIVNNSNRKIPLFQISVEYCNSCEGSRLCKGQLVEKLIFFKKWILAIESFILIIAYMK
jgi:hypothetical protein